MPLFNFYMMVDRSGAARRRGMRPDFIWIAFGNIKDADPVADAGVYRERRNASSKSLTAAARSR
jgi:hypothetical protein